MGAGTTPPSTMLVALAKPMERGASHLDESLLEQVRAGDEAATRAMLGAVGPAVLRAVRGVLGANHPDVPDLVQETFVAMLRALAGFRGECSLRHFATRIASNLAVSSLRKHGRRKETPIDDVEAGNLPDAVAADDLHANAVAHARMRVLRASLAALPEAQAEALALRWVLGHSLAEVAEITGAPVNTVRSRLRLGRAVLVKLLREDPQWLELEEEGR